MNSSAAVDFSFHFCHRYICPQDGISWVIADANRIRWAANCDFTGLNIEERRTTGEMCGPQCLSRLDCIGFVWTDFEGGTCWLKSRGHPIIAYTGTGGVCGEIIGRRASYGSPRQSRFGIYWKRN